MSLGKDEVMLRLGRAEALILFELLADFHEQPVLAIPDEAARLSLVRLHGGLESTLVELFDSDYQKLVAEARTRLTSESEEAP